MMAKKKIKKIIYKYIAEDNPGAAERVAEGIYRKVQILAEFPETGYRYRTESEGDIRSPADPRHGRHNSCHHNRNDCQTAF